MAKPITDEHSGSPRVHKERRYHYPREARGVEYEDFDVKWLVQSTETSTPTNDEPGGSDPEEVKEPEKQEWMPDWVLATLCVLAFYLFLAYMAWAATSDSPGQSTPDLWKH